MDIILYLLQLCHQLYQQNCWLINFICRYIPLKQWAFDDSHSPKYQKFKIDELPLIQPYAQDWTYKELIPYWQKTLWQAHQACYPQKRIIRAQMEQPCNQVDHIASDSAPEAVIKVRVEFEAWVAVIVERTSDHVMAGHGKPVCLGSLQHADTCFNSFKKVHSAFPPSELFGFFILVSYTEKMPGS
jgi:hypothetical protein